METNTIPREHTKFSNLVQFVQFVQFAQFAQFIRLRLVAPQLQWARMLPTARTASDTSERKLDSTTQKQFPSRRPRASGKSLQSKPEDTT